MLRTAMILAVSAVWTAGLGLCQDQEKLKQELEAARAGHQKMMADAKGKLVQGIGGAVDKITKDAKLGVQQRLKAAERLKGELKVFEQHGKLPESKEITPAAEAYRASKMRADGELIRVLNRAADQYLKAGDIANASALQAEIDALRKPKPPAEPKKPVAEGESVAPGKRTPPPGFVRADLDPAGRWKDYDPGKQWAYHLWQDEQGWHLRVSAKLRKHFYGAVEVQGGHFKAVTALKRADREDKVSVSPANNRLEFNFHAENREAGFDFQVTDKANDVWFVLKTKPVERSKAIIHVGKEGKRPPSETFILPAHPPQRDPKKVEGKAKGP